MSCPSSVTSARAQCVARGGPVAWCGPAGGRQRLCDDGVGTRCHARERERAFGGRSRAPERVEEHALRIAADHLHDHGLRTDALR